MIYKQKDFSHLLGTQGFSDNLLNNHFTLYHGYVNNVNKLSEALVKLDEENKSASPEYAEQKRRLGWEWNGMRLHEYYFDNMGKNSKTANRESQITAKIAGQFGSFEKWEKDFRATGAMRGIGWTILYQDLSSENLFNAWITEHDMGHLAGCKPLLVLDVFEHAYMLDYGLKRTDYIEAFMQAIDWTVAERRYLE